MEVPKSVEDLETSTSVSGKRMPSFEVLDSMVGSGVRKKNLLGNFKKTTVKGRKRSTEEHLFFKFGVRLAG